MHPQVVLNLIADVKCKFRSSGQIHLILYNENKFLDLLIARGGALIDEPGSFWDGLKGSLFVLILEIVMKV